MTTSQDEVKQEEFILKSSISEDRVASFYSDYLESRHQSGAVEAAFERAQTFRRELAWDDQYGIGVNVVLRKGPFVEGSNWIGYQGWEFALAVERNLLSKFEEMLRGGSSIADAQPVQSDWKSILAVADELLNKMDADRIKSCIVVSGPLHENWLLDLTRQPGVVPDWDLPKQLNRNWIHGTYRDALILHIRESEEPTVFAADLGRFGRLTRHGRPIFEVVEIDEKRAKKFLDERPDLSKEPDPVRDLMLKVWMKLYESWSFEALDVTAAAYTPRLSSNGTDTG